MGDMDITWVIPCYNEAERLSVAMVEELLEDAACQVLFVDDGSTDTTLPFLHQMAAQLGGRVAVHALSANGGKAEAVRQGLQVALAKGPPCVGYLDADFATPPQEAHRLAQAMRTSGASVVMGARVRRLGTEIDRTSLRHYLGRVFSTVAALSLGVAVYDTQCGAKLFQSTRGLNAALEAPFRSRWAFDVELIGRLLDEGLTADDFLEVPLNIWRDVGGSKLTNRAMLSAGVDLLGLLRRGWHRRR